MQVIAVSNQKGGVGKTTTALSLAADLALQRRRVLAIDMDPQGNLSLGAGLQEPFEGPTLYEVLTSRVSLDAAAMQTPHRGLETLRVVPAGPMLSRAETELIGQIGFDEILRRKLNQSPDWDAVVIDCSPSLGPLTVNAVGAANLVLVPVQCEYFSARGVVKLLELVELVRERRNPGLLMRVVPTLYDRRNNICRAVLAELRKQFRQEITEVVVGIDTRLRESQAHCTPICLYAPRSRASLAYGALTQELQVLLSKGDRHVQAA